MRSICPILILFVLGRVSAEIDKGPIWKGFSVICAKEESGQVVDNSTVPCQRIRIVQSIVNKLLEDVRKMKSIELLNGIILIEKRDLKQSARDGRFLKDYGLMGTIIKWLEGKELQIKLPILLPFNLKNAIEQSLPSSDEEERGDSGGGGIGGFDKHKGEGNGGVMLMALVMGNVMAAMGFGALGLLAMKALAVSSAALVMSLIAAAKKMSGGKDEESHHVVYAQEISHNHH